MKMVWLCNEKNAIQYVYENAIPPRISFCTFERLVQNSKNGCLPEFYVITDNGEYIGYLLLLADNVEDIPPPFKFLACHNGDQLSEEEHKELLEFIKKRGCEKGWKKLVWLAENEIKEKQRQSY
ncbi:MAG: hypothetical protein ACI4EH_11190 [Oliverpabstia sp.]